MKPPEVRGLDQVLKPCAWISLKSTRTTSLKSIRPSRSNRSPVTVAFGQVPLVECGLSGCSPGGKRRRKLSLEKVASRRPCVQNPRAKAHFVRVRFYPGNCATSVPSLRSGNQASRMRSGTFLHNWWVCGLGLCCGIQNGLPVAGFFFFVSRGVGKCRRLGLLKNVDFQCWSKIQF